MKKINYQTNNYNNHQNGVLEVTSRDDDATSWRSSGGGGGGCASSVCSQLSTGSTREDLYSKIEELNAKSQALRGIIYNPSSSGPTTEAPTSQCPPPSYVSPFSYNNNARSHYSTPTLYSPSSILSSSSYSPTSVISQPFNGSGGNYNIDWPGKYSSRDPSNQHHVDSRLEYLNRASLALRNRVSQAEAAIMGAGGGDALPSVASNAIKKVTFDFDYNAGINISSVPSVDERSACSYTPSKSLLKKKFLDEADAVSTRSTSPLTSSRIRHSGNTASIVNTTVKSNVEEDNASVAVLADKSSSSLAMKILSEKILDGYSMTRNHCPACNMAILRRPKPTPQESSITFNSDGSVNKESLKKLEVNREKQAGECVFCPIAKLRKTISRGVCKQVMAAILLSGLEINSSGRLCRSCQSPSLQSKGGSDVQCQVCSILDAACIEIVREQGRGGLVQEFRHCIKCHSPEVLLSSERGMKCVVCDVVTLKLEERYSSNRANTASSGLPFNSDVSVALSDTVKPLGQRPSFASHAQVVLSKSPSQPPDLSMSNSIKSNNNNSEPDPPGLIADFAKIELSKMQNQIASELDKAQISQKSLKLKMPTLGCQPLEEVKTACRPMISDQGTEKDIDQEIVKSPSITSGDSPPVTGGAVLDIANLQDQLKSANEKLPAKASTDLTMVQDQLNAELMKAKESQLMLERILKEDPNNDTAASIGSRNSKIREEILAEIDKSRQAQASLETILNDVELTMEEDMYGAETNELLADADDIVANVANASSNFEHISYSISQQEVDATGNLKEYIPPPSYFSPNIPSVVVVYHIPEDGDQSVAAKSHHTKNLKNTERDARKRNSSIFDCCADSIGNQYVHEDYYDYDTIETDDDHSVDYTLNTMDDSRLDHLRYSTMQDEDEEGRHHVRDENRIVRKAIRGHGESQYHGGAPKSAFGKCFNAYFGCCSNNDSASVGDFDNDAYSMVSRRGILVHQQNQQKEQWYSLGTYGAQHQQCQMERNDMTRSPSCRPSQEEPHPPNQSIRVDGVGASSEFGSRPSLSKRDDSSGTRAPLNSDKYNTGESKYRLDRTDNDSMNRAPPSPTSDWDNENNGSYSGSDFGSMCRVTGKSPPSSPRVASYSATRNGTGKPSMRPPSSRSNHYNYEQNHQWQQQYAHHSHRPLSSCSSGQSSALPVMFGTQHQQQLRALTEESENAGSMGRYEWKS